MKQSICEEMLEEYRHLVQNLDSNLIYIRRVAIAKERSERVYRSHAAARNYKY